MTDVALLCAISTSHTILIFETNGELPYMVSNCESWKLCHQVLNWNGDAKVVHGSSEGYASLSN